MAAKAARDAATHYLQFDIQWSSIALLFYDYALTFPMEAKYMWGSKPRLSTVLYVFCRYALVANVLYLLAIAKRLGASCDTWYKIIGALSVFGRAAVIVTFSARTYAIYGQNKWILGYLAILGAACVALDITHVPGLRCVGSSSIPIANELLAILMVIFEYSSAILMIIRSVQAFRVNGAWRAQKGGFLYMIFEQGLFYFSVVSLFTTAAVVLNYRAPSGFFQRLLNALTLPLSGLLTARFLLHLRKWEHKQSTHGVSGEGPNSDTMGSFRAAPGRGQSTLLSTIIDEFGNDPVAVASSSKKLREVGTTTIKPDTQSTNVVEETSSATGSGPSSSSGNLANSVKEEKRSEPTINASHFV